MTTQLEAAIDKVLYKYTAGSTASEEEHFRQGGRACFALAVEWLEKEGRQVLQSRHARPDLGINESTAIYEAMTREAEKLLYSASILSAKAKEPHE